MAILLFLALVVVVFGNVNLSNYEITHTLKLRDGASIFNLDETTLIKNVMCNVGNNTMILQFKTLDDKKVFMNNNINTITSSNICNSNNIFIGNIDRIDDKGDDIVEITTLPLKYTDIFENLDLQMKKKQNIAEKVCIGYNENANCNKADTVINLYQDKYVRVDCSNCFVGLIADIFFNVKIGFFKLKEISGGFKNISFNTGTVLTTTSAYSWNYIYDKTFPIIRDKTIITFSVVGVPIRIYFDIPLEIKILVHINTMGTLTAGINTNLNIGDCYVEWNTQSGWQFVKPNPVLTMNPVLDGLSTINGDGQIQIVPAFNLHVNNFFWYGIKITPEIDTTIYGDTKTKKLCIDGTGKFSIDGEGELDADIPWAYTKTYHFNNNLYSYTKNIGQYCIQK